MTFALLTDAIEQTRSVASTSAAPTPVYPSGPRDEGLCVRSRGGCCVECDRGGRRENGCGLNPPRAPFDGDTPYYHTPQHLPPPPP